MLITVRQANGEERFSYSTDKDQNCLHPSREEVPAVVEALREAISFLIGPAGFNDHR